MIGRTPTRRTRTVQAIIGLLLAGTLVLCAGCDLLGSHTAAFSAGYLLGRWEATRVEIVRTERVCFQNDVQVPCPPAE